MIKSLPKIRGANPHVAMSIGFVDEVELRTDAAKLLHRRILAEPSAQEWQTTIDAKMARPIDEDGAN